MKREKASAAAVIECDLQIREYQWEKQQQLNQISSTIPLKLSQLLVCEEDVGPLASALLPPDLTGIDLQRLHDVIPIPHHLLFILQKLSSLQALIETNRADRDAIKRQHSDLKRMHVALNRRKKEKALAIADLRKKYVEVQMLKFGRMVDVEQLEKIQARGSTEERHGDHVDKGGRSDAEKHRLKVKVSSLITRRSLRGV